MSLCEWCATEDSHAVLRHYVLIFRCTHEAYLELLSGAGYWPVYPVSVITGMRTGVGMPDSRLLNNRYSSAGYRITG
jgi:hypothetical protein